uniref:Uncharacterized protein n=1 Tax=Hanusia phi TaxID=3032 RepID=A0A7S0NEX0_9CRYP|mmetsp:Transcript_8913/g.20347  ORF Transcript_8913/g.20347 Transcript_8913/m.20347 type:complete len:1017 (+) Transcript_8913:2312-5362(+)
MQVTSNLLFTLRPAAQEVVVLGFSDGLVQVLAADSYNKEPLLVPVDTLEGHMGPVCMIRPSHDGTRFLSFNPPFELFEWDTLRGQQLRGLTLDFPVMNVDYAGSRYHVLLASQRDIRKLPPASLSLPTDGEKAEAEEPLLVETGEEDGIDSEAGNDQLLEMRTKYGLEIWKSIAAKTFAQGFYGDLQFLGPYQVEGVFNTCFEEKSEDNSSEGVLYLFSRHNGVLQKRQVNEFDARRLIKVGGKKWNEMREYSQSRVSASLSGSQALSPITSNAASGVSEYADSVEEIQTIQPFHPSDSHAVSKLPPPTVRQSESSEEVESSNLSIVLNSKNVPPWARRERKPPSFIFRDTHKPKALSGEESFDDWGQVPIPYKREHVSEIQPYVSSEQKLALSKQGMKAQFLNTEPEAWDSPEVVEMLTRVRISELRRSKSQLASAETGEKYLYGTSQLVDELLDDRNGAADTPRGRSISVPLIDRPIWNSVEVPKKVAGVDISLSRPPLKSVDEVLQLNQPSKSRDVFYDNQLIVVGENGLVVDGSDSPLGSPIDSSVPEQRRQNTAGLDSIKSTRSQSVPRKSPALPSYLPSTRESPDHHLEAEATFHTSRGQRMSKQYDKLSMSSLVQHRGSLDVLSDTESVSLIMQGLRFSSTEKGKRAPSPGVWSLKSSHVETPLDDESLYLFNGVVLEFSQVLQNLQPCTPKSSAEKVCFYADFCESPGTDIWEQVVIKEVESDPSFGLTQAMIDALKPVFGINCMKARRIILDGKLRKKSVSSHWLGSDCSKNFVILPTSQDGGTHYLIFHDYTNRQPAPSLADWFGKSRSEQSRLDFSQKDPAIIDFLMISAFRLMTECKAFDLDSVLVLADGNYLLPIGEMEALNRKFPYRGILQGSNARELRVRMAAMLQEVIQRIQQWWEKVSLGKVWMTLSKFGFNSDHLKRMVQNMRHLAPTMESMLLLEDSLNPLVRSAALKADLSKETTIRKTVKDSKTMETKKEAKNGVPSGTKVMSSKLERTKKNKRE